MCKHENHMLTGTADGIRCRGCGAVFHSLEDLAGERPEELKEQEKKPPKKGGKKND